MHVGMPSARAMHAGEGQSLRLAAILGWKFRQFVWVYQRGKRVWRRTARTCYLHALLNFHTIDNGLY